jgi:acyl-CoA thioester hydrolase
VREVARPEAPGRSPAATSTSTIRVRYAETDQMGVAHHREYFAWFEVGRTDLLRGLGLSYRELEQQGIRLPVIEAQARYFTPAHYDDLLEIRTAVTAMTGARVSFAYEVRRAETEGCLAVGSTSHAAIDPKGRPRRLPAHLRSRLA